MRATTAQFRPNLTARFRYEETLPKWIVAREIDHQATVKSVGTSMLSAFRQASRMVVRPQDKTAWREHRAHIYAGLAYGFIVTGPKNRHVTVIRTQAER